MIQGRRGVLARLPLLGGGHRFRADGALQSLEERLLSALERIKTVNTHEHTIPERERSSQRVDFFTLDDHGLPARASQRVSAPSFMTWASVDLAGASGTYTLQPKHIQRSVCAVASFSAGFTVVRYRAMCASNLESSAPTSQTT